MKEKMKGIFIPFEFYKLGLTCTEREMLAIYKYYSEKGELKCSVYTNQSIAEMINVNVQTVKKAKKRLKKLGYIRTNGGIKTYYQGINKEQNTTVGGCETQPGGIGNTTVGGCETQPGGIGNTTVGGCETQPIGGCETQPHNKEEKRIKKENNKEIIKNKKRENKEEMKSELKEKQTVFDRMIPFMNQEIKEHIDYIKETYKEQIDNINKAEEYGEITESHLRDQLKLFKNNILDKDDKIISNKKVVPKEDVRKEKDVSYIDLF